MFSATQKLIRTCFAAALLIAAQSSNATTYWLGSSGHSWVNSQGQSGGWSPEGNTVTGSGNGVDYNSFASFYIPDLLGETLVSVTLNGVIYTVGDVGPQTLNIYDVSSAPSASISSFLDLQTGTQYGSITGVNAGASNYSVSLAAAIGDVMARSGNWFYLGFTNVTDATSNHFAYPGGIDLRNPSFGLVLQTVSAVPLPAAAWLFGSALVGMLGLKRRASKKPSANSGLAMA